MTGGRWTRRSAPRPHTGWESCSRSRAPPHGRKARTCRRTRGWELAAERNRLWRVRGGRRQPVLGELQSGHRRAAARPLLPGVDRAQPPQPPQPPMDPRRRPLGRREPGHLPRAPERVLPGRQVRALLERGDHRGHRALRRPAGRPADAPGAVRPRPSMPRRTRGSYPSAAPIRLTSTSSRTTHTRLRARRGRPFTPTTSRSRTCGS